MSAVIVYLGVPVFLVWFAFFVVPALFSFMEGNRRGLMLFLVGFAVLVAVFLLGVFVGGGYGK